MAIDYAELGLTKEEVQDRVVERICDRLLTEQGYDEDSGTFLDESGFKRRLVEKLRGYVDKKIVELGDLHIAPKVAEMIEKTTLHATNQWGEKRGEPLTFIEYLVHRAEAYMTEQVNFEGKGKGEDSYGSCSWKPSQTRVVHMVHQHLHYEIERAMKQALEDANKSIAGGIESAIKIKLQEILSGIKVSAEVKR